MDGRHGVDEVAAQLMAGIGLLVRRLRQGQAHIDDLSMPETSALARLDRGGPTTAAALAKVEQISPQSMGATIAALEARGLVERRPDPGDGRRILLAPSTAGLEVLRTRRDARTERLAQVITASCSAADLRALAAAAPVLERLAQGI